ncbi:MAG: DUF308 domain-containing protein [Clostridia bacterium]|nr:DUF308 domain-containing protein [Clostridia bacterium]
MKSLVKSITNCVIVVSVIALILGIVLMAYPIQSIETLGIILGVYWIINGITLIVLDIKALRRNLPFNGLLPGILGLILGILMMYNQANVEGFMEAFVGIALGIWVISNGISNISRSLSLRRSGAPWGLLVAISIIDICLGVMILYSPVLGALAYTTVTGLFLVIDAIVMIIYMFIVKKNSKELEEVIENAVKSVDAKALEALKKADEAAATAAAAATVVEDAPQAEPAAEEAALAQEDAEKPAEDAQE